MKISRRGFIGTSILSTIPSFDVIGSVFQKQEPPIRRGLAVVSCQKLYDPEICVGTWKLPEYLITAEVGESDFHGKWKLVRPAVGRIIKNRILFLSRDGKEIEIKESENTRILFLGTCLDSVTSDKRLFKESYSFQEVPAVIFQKNKETAEEVFGVADFPSISQ